MSSIKQTERLIKLTTPFGGDTLLLDRFEGFEKMSQLFAFRLRFFSEKGGLDFATIVGKPVTLTVEMHQQQKRYFNGIISRFTQSHRHENLYRYEGEMVPWLWFLTRTADSRIFQNKSVPDIISQIFKEYGLADFQFKLRGSFQPREYCVQYRETDFNFITRLLEEEGMFYYFEHKESQHMLIIGNNPDACPPCPVHGSVRFHAEKMTEDQDAVSDWREDRQMRPGKWAIKDYNFETPSTNLHTDTETLARIGGNSKYEIYDYPGLYRQRGDGERLVKLRMEEEEAEHQLFTGEGNCRDFSPGFAFTMSRNPRANHNQKYLITSVHHVGDNNYNQVDKLYADYHNYLTAIPHSVVFRPPRVTPKPVIHGVQTAVVVGPKGEEIYTDRYMRIKVQFHWDREGKYDDQSSCWMRCAQNMAGKRWGMTFIPRIGQEVVVTFLEGDPDRPLVCGGVYNAEQMPPYLGQGLDPKHPSNAAVTGFKSNSTKGGSGYNELRFDDNAGREQIYMHSQKDLDLRVKHDLSETVDNDVSTTVGANRTEKIGGNQETAIEGDLIQSVGGHYEFAIKGNQDLDVGGDKAETLGGSLDHTVGLARTESVGTSMSLKVGLSMGTKAGLDYAVEATKEIHLKAGMNLVIEAGLMITIKASGGFISIGPDGVTIQGIMVKVNSGGAAMSGGGASVSTPKKAKKAKPKAPKVTDKSVSGSKSSK